MRKISRKEAIEKGIKHYFTGKPCPNGHLTYRFVSSYTCAECAQMHKRKYRKDPEFRARELEYKRKYREKNREKILEYARRRWREDENTRKRDAEYRRINADVINERQRRWYWENRDYHRARMKEYRDKNRQYFLDASRKRRALKMSADGRHTRRDVERILAMQRGRCANCLKCVKRKYHIDHIQPLSKGGSDWPSNLQILCPRCNISKSAKDPIKWAQMNGRLL